MALVSAFSDTNRICLVGLPTTFPRDYQRPVHLTFSVLHRSIARFWNINQIPIDYAFRPRLRSRLTLRR